MKKWIAVATLVAVAYKLGWTSGKWHTEYVWDSKAYRGEGDDRQ
jgi:hypothetical protein